MAQYSPQPAVSIQSVEDLRQWVEDELANLSQAFNELNQVIELNPIFVAPDRRKEGMLVYADGVRFNPGSGEGPYVWDGAVWQPMIGPTSAQSAAIVANTTAIATNTANITTNTTNITTLQATSPPGLVFLSSQTVSNTAFVVFTGISATYDAYQFYITRMKPSVDFANLHMQISIDGGSTWQTTSNVWTWLYSTASLGTTALSYNNAAEGNANYFRISSVASSSWNSNVEVILYPSTSGIGLNMLTWRSTDWYSSTGIYQTHGSGAEVSDSNPCNAVRFFFSSGNMVSGRISMYGLRKT